MKHYKSLLLKKLVDSGWELKTQDSDTEWWLEELWEVESIKQQYGYRVYVSFLVDLQYEGTRKSQAVWAIGAATEIPESYSSEEQNICTMDLQKGKFDEKLSSFVDKINHHRNNIGL